MKKKTAAPKKASRHCARLTNADDGFKPKPEFVGWRRIWLLSPWWLPLIARMSLRSAGNGSRAGLRWKSGTLGLSSAAILLLLHVNLCVSPCGRPRQLKWWLHPCQLRVLSCATARVCVGVC
jgi:hypothetical protein